MPADRELVEASANGATTPRPAPTLAGDLVSMLDRLAQTIVDALGFGVAVVNLARPDGSLEVVSVAGDEQAKAALLGRADSAIRWDEMLEASEPWGALRFIDHRNEAATEDILSWVPQIDVLTGEDAWHGEDALFAPLTAADGSRLGVLSVDLPHDGRRPTPTTCRALEAFAISAALAIEHATLRRRAEASEARYRALASQDQLTGIANRFSITRDVDLATRSQQQDQHVRALVFLDLDGFKQINDLHSHAAGDHVLQTVATRLRRQLRPGDQVARWGGDEFLVLLHNLGSERDALHVLERLSAAVAEPIPYAGQQLQVSASAGMALLGPGKESTTDDLVRRADAAMYEVKLAGRDSTTGNHPTTPPDRGDGNAADTERSRHPKPV